MTNEDFERPHRPGRYADVAKFVDSRAWDDGGFDRAEIAAVTASLVLAAGRGEPEHGQLLELSETVGLQTLAELWRDADAVSLPGVLWVMYLLQRWCRQQSEEVARLWQAGSPYAPADTVVAGVADRADPDSVRTLADAILSGAYGGDFAVALERAAAFFRVIAAGRREGVHEDRESQLTLAARNDRTADQLRSAAATWRAGQLH